MTAPAVRVLLAEDDSNDILFFQRAAAKLRLPWVIEVATDGETAARILQEEGAPSHVVLDLKLPRRSGLEVLAALRADPARTGTRVVVLTSSQERRDLDEATRLGVDRYLVKPVSTPELLRIVGEIARIWGMVPAEESGA